MEGHRSTFLGQKHKSAIWDRTPPHLHIKPSLYVCRRVQGSQIFKQNGNYLDSFKFYCIFSNCKWLSSWRHPCLSCLTCMFICVYMHACMHMCACIGHSIYPHPPTPPATYPIYPQGGDTPNQLKCYNT